MYILKIQEVIIYFVGPAKPVPNPHKNPHPTHSCTHKIRAQLAPDLHGLISAKGRMWVSFLQPTKRCRSSVGLDRTLDTPNLDTMHEKMRRYM